MKVAGELDQWAKAHGIGMPWAAEQVTAAELTAFEKLIGDARIVGLSEPVHGSLQPLAWRNRLIRHCVEYLGFRLILLESGFAESRLIHDYVAGLGSDLRDVMERGFSWTFGALPQNRELVQWLRAWNTGAAERVNLYGFDLSGSPGNAEALRGPATAVEEALKFLARLDPVAEEEFRQRLQPFHRFLKFSLWETQAPSFRDLNEQSRFQLTSVLTELERSIQLVPVRDRDMATERAWGVACARHARAMDEWLRQYPPGPLPRAPTDAFDPGQIPFILKAHDVRDRAQAETIRSLVQREGSPSRALLFAARFHIAADPVSLRLGCQPHRQRPAGSYLREWFADSYVSIGTLFDGGASGFGDFHANYTPPPVGSLDAWARDLGRGPFILNLREARDHWASALDAQTELAVGACCDLLVRPRRAFDALQFFGELSPAQSGLAPC